MRTLPPPDFEQMTTLDTPMGTQQFRVPFHISTAKGSISFDVLFISYGMMYDDSGFYSNRFYMMVTSGSERPTHNPGFLDFQRAKAAINMVEFIRGVAPHNQHRVRFIDAHSAEFDFAFREQWFTGEKDEEDEAV